jgi:hypothetical protein
MFRKQTWRCAAAAILSLAFVAPPALAQDDEEQPPPYDVTAIKRERQWVPWVAAFLFATAVILVAFKNPHRTHLD